MVGPGGPGGARGPWGKAEGGRRKEESKTKRRTDFFMMVRIVPSGLIE
jgi:hypothetical protein